MRTLVVSIAATVVIAQGPASPSVTAELQLRIGIARPGGRSTIAAIPLEVYVARVLAGEAARDSPPAALEALAITIRTFALANRGRHRADGFDLCDQTHCQVLRTATPATERAAAATAGRVLLYQGVPRLGVLQRLVRRPDRDSLRRMARRRGSSLPAVAARRSVRGCPDVDGRPRRQRSAPGVARGWIPRRAPARDADCFAQRIRARRPFASGRILSPSRFPVRICAPWSDGRWDGNTSRARRSI